MKKNNPQINLALLAVALISSVLFSGCAMFGPSSVPAQPISIAEVNNQFPEGTARMLVLEDPDNPSMSLNIFRNSMGNLVSINLLAKSNAGNFGGDELMFQDTSTLQFYHISIDYYDNTVTLNGCSYYVHSDFNGISVTEEFGKKQIFAIRLNKLYAARYYHAMNNGANIDGLNDLPGFSYYAADQGGNVGAEIFFSRQSADYYSNNRITPDYVVPLTRYVDGSTAPIGDEVPIANSGYELKRNSPSDNYRVIKLDQ